MRQIFVRQCFAVVALAATLGLVGWAPAAGAATRSVPIPVVGGTTFVPSDFGNPMNRHGVIAGTTRIDDSDVAAILDTRTGRMRTLGTFGGVSSAARDINSAGYVVGFYSTVDATHPFLWAPNGRFYDLGTLGGGYGYANSLNDVGFIVGNSTTVSGEMHAFVRNPSTYEMRDLGTLGGPYSEAYSINSAGFVVGMAFDATHGGRAFVWSPQTRTMRDIGVVPGTDLARANDINDSNTVVGESFTAADNSNLPFIWKPGFVHPRQLAGRYAFGTARAVAGDGTIVGQVTSTDGTFRAAAWRRQGHSIVILPAPPGSMAVATIGAGWIVGTTSDGIVRWAL